MDFRGPRNHIRLVSGRLSGRRERKKEGRNADGANKGGEGESSAQKREKKGKEKDRETRKEMVGAETSVTVTVQRAELILGGKNLNSAFCTV